VNKTTIWILTPSFSFHIWKKNIFKISQYEKRQRWPLLLKNKHHNNVKFKQRDANLRWLLIHLSKVNYFLTAYHTVNINSYKPKKKKHSIKFGKLQRKQTYHEISCFDIFILKNLKNEHVKIYIKLHIYKSYSYYIMLKFKGEINVRSKPISHPLCCNTALNIHFMTYSWQYKHNMG
jgi:hypothetical protein